MVLSIFSKHSKYSGTTIIRCIQTMEYLKLIDVNSRFNLIYSNYPKKSDNYCFIHRAKNDNYFKKFIAYTRAANIPTIYDTDDLLFESSYDLKKGNLKELQSDLFLSAMKSCDYVTVSTKFLKEKALKYHSNVFLIRNALSNDFFYRSSNNYELKQNKKEEFIVLAYLSGSSSHDSDFEQIEDVLVSILEKYSNTKLLIVGPLKFNKHLFEKFKNRFEHSSKVPYNEYHLIFRKIDINLVPLELNDFCHAKSEIKYIEAAASGIPSVLSPTMTHQDVIKNGVNGFLCYNENDWFNNLALLINDTQLRDRIGLSARNHVIKKYTAKKRSKDLSLLLKNINDSFQFETLKPLNVIKYSLSLFLIINFKKIKILKKRVFNFVRVN